MSAPVAIGIDFGTTNACVGVWCNGRVEIVPNDLGNPTTPAYVAFTYEESRIGDIAKQQNAVIIRNTVWDTKRLLGRKFGDATVQADMKRWSFLVTKDPSEKPMINVSFRGEKRQFTAEEISSMVLVKMKEIAEAYLGCEVKNTVITVPTNFNDAQRQATRDAATAAGLNVMRLIRDPVAAALAYGLDRTGACINVLTFDLGGGTLDVSLLTIEDGIIEVKATAGDMHLGGSAFDSRLMDHFAQEFKRKSGKDIAGNPCRNPCPLLRLRSACERAKRTLSSSTHATILIDSLFDGIDFSTIITRRTFEELNMDYFRKCMQCVEKVLYDAQLDKTQVHEIVLVGGSTRIPKVQELLSEFFNGKELTKAISPDEVVAYGATVQAAILAGSDKTVGHPDGLICLEPCPLSLGVETAEGCMANVLHRGAILPAQKSKTFTTCVENQTSMVIRVFEGELRRAQDNIFRGSLQLAGIPPMPRGVPRIEVSVSYTEDGVILVSAVETSTGREARLTFGGGDDRRQAWGEVERMLQAREVELREDEREARRALEKRVRQVQDFLDDNAFAKEVAAAGRIDVQKRLNVTTAWLVTNRDAEKEEIEEKQKALEAMALTLRGFTVDGAAVATVPSPGSCKDGRIEEAELVQGMALVAI